jgi:DNA topoisomerase I
MHARPGKRKKASVPASPSEDDDDDVPLAVATPQKAGTKPKTAAVSMPGALEATTVPVANGRGKKKAPTSAALVPKKEESNSDGADDAPLAARTKATNGTAKRAPRKSVKAESDADDSDDDKPLSKPPARKKRKVKQEDNSSDEDDKPLAKTPAAKKKAAAGSSKKVKKEEVEAESDTETPAPTKNGKVKKEAKTKKGKVKNEEDDDVQEEDVFEWWKQDAPGDGTDKWQTLVHNGVYFPPPYVPLPKSVKMKYNGGRAFPFL